MRIQPITHTDVIDDGHPRVIVVPGDDGPGSPEEAYDAMVAQEREDEADALEDAGDLRAAARVRFANRRPWLRDEADLEALG